MDKIVWLASYPKSGNTWFRVFLTNLLEEKDQPADINDLRRTPIASARGIFDDEVGIEASDLTPDEVDRLRPAVYDKLAAEADEPLFMKVHDAYTLVDGKTPLFPASATKGVIYLIRNPLDVAVSFAHHSGWDYERSVEKMNENTMTFCRGTRDLPNQLRQKLLTWSDHVRSWTRQTALPVCVIRYEDMKQTPVETFGRAIRFAGLTHTDEQIQTALSKCTIEELKRQEQESGFHEKSPAADSFFQKGVIGSWKEELSTESAERIVQHHKEIMEKFSYLTDSGEPCLF